MILNKRADIERFLARPDPAIRAVLIYGRDLGVVRDRAQTLAARLVPNPDDPFDVAQVSEADLIDDPARLEAELAAQSLMGPKFRVTQERGKRFDVPWASAFFATIHPSAILRGPPEDREAALAQFIADLKIVAKQLK